MGNYYAENLNAAKLFAVYETRYPRVRQYFEAEIDFVRRDLTGSERILEIGAGYGRILKELAPHAASLVGIDVSAESVALGVEYLKGCPNCRMEVLDAYALPYRETFEVVLCLQNALSAVRGDAAKLVDLCLRATVPGGRVYCSSYSPRFWEHRLDWFREQAAKGLLGEIDEERTGDGQIVCRDGFRATTFSEEDLQSLGRGSGVPFRVQEVDESSVFLVLEKPGGAS